METKVLLEDDLAPFSSDKIRAKILDLGYGGARRALLNLSPKSARILSLLKGAKLSSNNTFVSIPAPQGPITHYNRRRSP